MKVKRSEAAAVDYKGELYVFNGFSKGLSVGNSIEKYNPNSKQWKVIGNTSVANGTAVTHTGTVLVGNDVWLIGGRIGSHPGKVTQNVWIYNLDNLKWRKGPKLPKPMAGGGAALVDGKIYAFGGMDAKAQCDVGFHFVYNLKKPSSGWQNITGSAGMPSPRNHFSTVVINKTIYAVGGQHGHDGCPKKRGGNVALVHSYTPQTNKWKRLANLPAIESHNEPSTFVHNGFIYTVGGATAGNKVLRFDPGKNKWQYITSLPERLLAPVARIYNGRLIVAGGGAPITAKSKVQTRSIALAKFKDKASQSGNATNTAINTNTASTDVPTGVLTPVANVTVISVEAESFINKTGTSTHSWVTTAQVGASAGKSVKTTPDSGAIVDNVIKSPKLTYNVRFDNAGSYQLWIRGWGDQKANGVGGSDSLHAGLNGVKSNTADKIDGFPVGWHWSKRTRDGAPATLVIPAPGVHKINLWMREDGLLIDKFLLVQNEKYVPQGKGPSESDAPGVVAGTVGVAFANKGPTVNAGVNATVQVNTTHSLLGAVSDDGKPNGVLSSQWAKVSGPGLVVFEKQSSAATSASFNKPGTYVLQLKANDGSLHASDSVTISVSSAPTTSDTVTSNTNNTGAGGNTVSTTKAVLNEINGLVTIEAEQFKSKTGSGIHQWQAANYAGASGGKSLVVLPNKGKLTASTAGSPKLSYPVKFSAAGTYHVWIRGWGDENGKGLGGNDSVHAGLNSLISPTADKIDGFPKGWHWSNRTRDGVSAKISVPSAGVHTFNLWMREDGFAVDQIILSRKASYKPSGATTAAATNTTNIAGQNSSDTNNGNTSTAVDNTSQASTANINANTGSTGNSNGTVSSLVNTTGNVISVEAEDYLLRTRTHKHQWIKSKLAGASANASMVTTPNSGALRSDAKSAPMMSYLVNFPEAGKYYLWVRGWGDERTNGVGSNDSINAGLNGKLSASADKIDGFPKGWHWSRRTRDGAPAFLNKSS